MSRSTARVAEGNDWECDVHNCPWCAQTHAGAQVLSLENARDRISKLENTNRLLREQCSTAEEQLSLAEFGPGLKALQWKHKSAESLAMNKILTKESENLKAVNIRLLEELADLKQHNRAMCALAESHYQDICELRNKYNFLGTNIAKFREIKDATQVMHELQALPPDKFEYIPTSPKYHPNRPPSSPPPLNLSSNKRARVDSLSDSDGDNAEVSVSGPSPT